MFGNVNDRTARVFQEPKRTKTADQSIKKTISN